MMSNEVASLIRSLKGRMDIDDTTIHAILLDIELDKVYSVTPTARFAVAQHLAEHEVNKLLRWAREDEKILPKIPERSVG